jgi:prepilin-type N-terminal cleavage/methylation domain-containing protein
MRKHFIKKVSRLSQGFSLIELLVVISIMSILMALAAVSYTTAQQRGRDARRRSDMANIQKGFEQYFAQNNTYDSVAGCTTIGASATHFPAGLPSDPRNISPHVYTFQCSSTAYCVCARLESTNAGNSIAPATAVTCSFSSSGSTNYFCVSNLQ